MKLITFLVPCYNSEKEMTRCIDSLLTAGKAAEIIIINDGSNDRTGSIADDLAERYPTVVRVLHQEHIGRGDCIGQGIKHARGKYFKIVDSSDALDAKVLKAVIKKLKRLEHAGGIDLMVCNSVFEHEDESIHDMIVGYGNVFDTGRVLHWKATRPFLFPQILVLQSCIFRTAVCRKSGVTLQKNGSSEDNLFVYGQLPRCRRIYYLPAPLYHCLVRKELPLVDREAAAEKFMQQLAASEKILKLYDIGRIRKKNRRLGSYMYHEAVVMLMHATAYTRVNDVEEADEKLRDMWESLKKADPAMSFRLRYLSPVALMKIPGSFGRKLSARCYQFANKVVR